MFEVMYMEKKVERKEKVEEVFKGIKLYFGA